MNLWILPSDRGCEVSALLLPTKSPVNPRRMESANSQTDSRRKCTGVKSLVGRALQHPRTWTHWLQAPSSVLIDKKQRNYWSSDTLKKSEAKTMQVTQKQNFLKMWVKYRLFWTLCRINRLSQMPLWHRFYWNCQQGKRVMQWVAKKKTWMRQVAACLHLGPRSPETPGIGNGQQVEGKGLPSRLSDPTLGL